MKVGEVEACSFEKWYNFFTKVTFQSRILPLPEEVVRYLKSDNGIVLPIECDSDKNESEIEEWEDDTENDSHQKDITDEAPQRPSFPEFAAAVRVAIGELGGSVLPKLNWSAPRDASWMGLANSLKCTTLSEVMLLLKSSEFIIHDLTQPYKDCDESDAPIKDENTYVMVLRRWSNNINPGSEYRCFVKNKGLYTVCQRDTTHYYNHIKEEKDSIKRDIQTFFNEYIKCKLIDSDVDIENFSLSSHSNFVFDIIRKRKDVVRLVDFNPFGPTTDSLLFDWDELKGEHALQNTEENGFHFRFIENDAGIQPSGLRHYSIPTDFVDLSTGSDPHKFMDFLQLQQQMQSKEIKE